MSATLTTLLKTILEQGGYEEAEQFSKQSLITLSNFWGSNGQLENFFEMLLDDLPEGSQISRSGLVLKLCTFILLFCFVRRFETIILGMEATLQAYSDQIFDAFDVNDDNRLTREELTKDMDPFSGSFPSRYAEYFNCSGIKNIDQLPCYPSPSSLWSLISRLRLPIPHNKLGPFQDQFDELKIGMLALFDHFSIDGKMNQSRSSLNDPGITDQKVWGVFYEHIWSFGFLNSYWPPAGLLLFSKFLPPITPPSLCVCVRVCILVFRFDSVNNINIPQ